MDAELWATVSGDLGWCALAIPEAHGGLGLGQIEVMVLMEQVGRRLACLPLWSTLCLTVPLIVLAGSDAARERLLPAIAEGRLAATVACSGIASRDLLAGLTVTAWPDAGGYVLNGTVTHVLDLAVADLVIVPARLPDGSTGLFALDRADDFGRISLPVLDVTRPVGRLVLDGLRVGVPARIDEGGLDAGTMRRVAALASLGLAAEQLGAAQGAFDLTLAYIAGRVQFGRTIASFQAVKHRCARLAVDLAEARSMVFLAAAAADSGAAVDVEAEIAGARTLATQVQFACAEEAIQLHGGVGFTWGYDPHFYFRRAQADHVWLGSPDDHVAFIADHLLGTGGLA